MRQAYNEEGFLKAEVVGQPLTIDGTTGVLPVRRSRKARARRSRSLKWSPVPASRDCRDVEKAARFTPPAPYVVAEVNDARVRIEDHYRARASTTPRSRSQPAIAADDTVALTFNVAEGPQQVLQDVELTGNEVTNGKVVTQALRFELGKPVDLDEWTLARKRLYDTNVFRLVDIQPVPVGDAGRRRAAGQGGGHGRGIPGLVVALRRSSSKASGKPSSTSSPARAMPAWSANSGTQTCSAAR